MTESIQIHAMALGALTEDVALARWGAWLNAQERDRAHRFVYPVNRVEFIAAHALTRWALAGLMNQAPGRFDFVADDKGKPSALLDNQPAPVSFNLSHCTGCVGVAVSRYAGVNLGFDLEPLDRRIDLDVAGAAFSVDEQAWLKRQPADCQPRDFLRLWTLKEAYIKAVGDGLSAPLQAFSTEPDADPIGIRGIDGAWHFQQRELQSGHMAAVCWAGQVSGAPDWQLHGPEDL